MVRIGLAGFSQGYYATTYMQYLAQLKEVELVAVCDCGASDAYVMECAFITAGEFARELNVPLVHAYEALLDMRPDAVLICSETASHADMVRMALERGIHVFVSKPLTFLPGDTAKLKKIYGGQARLLCGNPLKYELGVEEMRTRIQSAEIGRVYSLRIMINHLAMTQQAWERDEARSGGPLGTYGIYLFDLARWLTGEPLTRLYALADRFDTPEITCPDTVKVLGRGVAGAQFTLELYSAIRHDYPFVRIEAVGTRGTLVTSESYATLAQTEKDAKLGALRASDMGAGEMAHFLACIHGKASERCSLEDMDYVVRCIDATRRSIRAGVPVEINPEGGCV